MLTAHIIKILFKIRIAGYARYTHDFLTVI